MMTSSRPYPIPAAAGRTSKKSLSGKTAFVTGVTGILGREVAKELARRGARLILQYNSSVRKACELELALKMLGTDVTMIQADFTQPSDMSELIQNVSSQTDHIDYLVHTAGVCRISVESSLIAQEEQIRIHQINQLAPIEITLDLEDRMKAESVILYVGSPLEDLCMEGMMVYGEAKRGLHHFAARYAEGMAMRGVSSIYYIPGVLRDSTPHVCYGQYGTEEMQHLGQAAPLEPGKAARTIVSALAERSLVSAGDEYDGALLVRRDGYTRQPISDY